MLCHPGPAAAARAGRPGSTPIQTLSTAEIVYCCAVILLAYTARGSTGFGGAIAMPLMGLVIPMKVLVPAWTIIGLCAGLTLIGRDRHHISWRPLVNVVPGLVIGIGIGLYLFTVLDDRVLTRGLGVIVIAYGAYALWGTCRTVPFPPVSSPLAGHLTGLSAGTIGTTFGALASVPFAIYFDVIRLAKHQFRATMTAVLIVLSVVRGLGYMAVGEFGRDVWFTVAITLPMMLIGLAIGDRVHTGVSEITFRRLIAVCLALSGLALVVK